PLGVVASIGGAVAGDTCFGPNGIPDEPESAPDSPVDEADCATAPVVAASGTTDDLANGAQAPDNRPLRIDFQPPGTYSLTLTAGVGPGPPLTGGGDVVDDDLTDNGSTRTLTATCVCPTKFQTIFVSKPSLAGAEPDVSASVSWSSSAPVDLIQGDLDQLKA